MTGRPLALTPAVANRLVDALGAGAPYRDAAALAGVSPSSVFAWLGRGRAEADRIERGGDPNPDESAFLELLERTSVACAALSVEVNRSWLQAVRRGDWRAAAAWDERHRRNTDDPVDRLDPEQVAEIAHVALSQAQGRVIADAMLRFGRLLLTAVETDGVDAARSRQGPLAREALTEVDEHGDGTF